MCLEQCMKCSKRTWMGSDLYQKLWRIVPVDMLPVAPQHGFRASSLTCSLVPLPPSLCVGMSSYFPDLVPKSFERDNSSSYQWSEGVLKVARSSIWSGEIRSVLSEPACWAGQIEAMLRTQPPQRGGAWGSGPQVSLGACVCGGPRSARQTTRDCTLLPCLPLQLWIERLWLEIRAIPES